MKRFLSALLPCLVAVLYATTVASAAHSKTPFHVNFSGSMTGSTIYFAPAGMEPDFDLVNRVIIKTHVHSRGLPPLTLILDAFLENFQSDTQPVLPDLIHPNQLLSTTLGGFFSGEAILVGPRNRILYTGSMLAEALINPICLTLPANTKNPPAVCLQEKQHMYVYLQGQGPARGSVLNMRSSFVGNQKLQVTSGTLYGDAKISKKVHKLLRRGSGSLTQKQILSDFNVRFPHQMGTNGSSSQKGPTGTNCFAQHCINPRSSPSATTKTGPRTGFTAPTTTPGASSGGIRWTMLLGFALIGLAVVLLAVYFWQGRREKQRTRSAHST